MPRKKPNAAPAPDPLAPEPPTCAARPDPSLGVTAVLRCRLAPGHAGACEYGPITAGQLVREVRHTPKVRE